jgi:aryl-alcohol dehydrogenase-like predicted oxidoreductase
MTTLPTATLGRTGFEVTRLGFGAMELAGFAGRITPDLAGRLLNGVLDAGINLIDTSPDYGPSEKLLGEHVSHRREEFFLASKCGCLVGRPPSRSDGFPEHVFTPENIRAGVEQSLRRMRTDHLDLVQFHASPSREVLEEHGAIEALCELQREGKVRFLGMSGVLPHLTDHIEMGVFDAFQIPYSALQRDHEPCIRAAARAGAGTIIRGGVARGAPAPDQDPDSALDFFRNAMREGRDEWERAKLDELLDGAPRMQFLLRFTLSHPDLHTTIVGTSNPDHLEANLAAARQGPLPDDVYAEARRRLET